MKCIFLALLPLLAHAAELSPPPPPGVVIDHSLKSSGLYIGSPSLCILPDGSYLASHDLFGPASSEKEAATGRIYHSTDKGLTWQLQATLKGFFWQGLFVHRGAAYAMGTTHHHGSLVIRRSTDNGKTWTDPTEASSGLISEGAWHTAPVPMIEHEGRLWRAVEDADNGVKWGERYQARMASAPADSDLLNAANWTISNPIKRDPSWLDGKFLAWLEGNAVVSPKGGIVDILRVDVPGLPEKAAIVEVGADGKVARFNPDEGFVDFPGGAKKFTIRKDPRAPGYWTLASIALADDAAQTREKPGGIRNTLALLYSKDLVKWETRCIVLRHPDLLKHGFQYVDWQFEGDDIIAVSRTAWDDAEGGAHNNHDANFLTFHRWKDFRKLERTNDVPIPEIPSSTHAAGDLTISGRGYEIGLLKTGQPAFTNRGYVWESVPDELAGKGFTRLSGGVSSSIQVTASKDTTVRILASEDDPKQKPGDWQKTPLVVKYNDAKNSPLRLFTRSMTKGQSIDIPQTDWAGTILVIDSAPATSN